MAQRGNVPAYLQDKKAAQGSAAPSAAPSAAKPPAAAAPAAAKAPTSAAPAATKAPTAAPATVPAKSGASSATFKSALSTSTVTRDDLTPCRSCGRRFLPDRVHVHEQICTATGQKKRKPFDPKAHRLAGTPAEAYNRGGKASAKSKPGSAKKPDWRRKHQDFIKTIRAAKEMKAHLAAGGKVSDLPPPPRSDYSDYINCPHCGRNFNQTAAERHIPQCAGMQHNKTGPKKK